MQIVCFLGESGSTNCMKLLLDNNADVNLQNDAGDSALHLAAKGNNTIERAFF